MTMSGTMSALEATWISIAVIGLLFSIWLTYAGWLDLAAVQAAIRETPPRARRWGPRWWVALSAVVANGALCLVWGGFLVIGYVASHYPPPPPNPDQAVSSYWVGWSLIVMEAVLAVVQVWHLYVRNRVEQTAHGTT